jgi:transcriptional regulator with XRE-family HTH domain
MPQRENNKLLFVGTNIRNWRIVRGYKQEWLADQLSISKVAISKIETGKTDIPLNRLYEIAELLDLEIYFLFQDPFDLINKKA